MKKIDNIIINNTFKELFYFLNKKKKYTNIIILLDNNTKKYCFNNILKKKFFIFKNKIKIIKIKQGEYNKDIKTCIKIWIKLINYNIDRKSLLINLGGGVITDLGGFIASLYKRGIDFINIPTTLLGIIDASIGGKNGINLLNYKNEIGVFNNPKYVFINYKFINTLPIKEIYSAYGEILKYGLIYSKKFWNYIKKINFSKKKINWEKIIYKSILIKNIIVNKDPFEKKGIRYILNFGHTIGHGIESLYLYINNPITHGEAIAYGMICEAWISNKKKLLNYKNYKDIYTTILKIYKLKIIKKKYFKKILNFIKNDKKNYNNKINLVLLKKIGKCTFNNEVNEKIIIKSLKNINKLIYYEK